MTHAPRAADVIAIHQAHREQHITSYIGIIVFVASWAMLFAALFMSYGVLRVRSVVGWPPPGFDPLPLGIPGIATVVLLGSSAALHRGWLLVRGGAPQRFLGHLLATIALGAVFLALQLYVWHDLWTEGMPIKTGHPYSGIFYLLTCFHALHVAVGVVFLFWLLPAALKRRYVGRSVGRIGVISVYWHFVGVVWGLMYVVLYVL